MFIGTKIIAAFCGTGKTYLCHNSNINCVEFECWKYREGDFPNNYIQDIKSQIGKVDYIFISTDPVVLTKLYEYGITVILVYPKISLKKEYLKRYEDRKSAINFIKMLNKNWNKWITELEKQDYCEHVVLKKNQYLQNIIIF
jgi:hypothetical protein